MSWLYSAFDTLRYFKGKQQQMHAARSLIKKASISVPRLTAFQKRKIVDYWEQYHIRMNDSFHRWYYAVGQQPDVRMIPNWYFQNTLLPYYNHTSLSNIPQSSFLYQAWVDKAYFDKFFPDVRFPKTIVRNIRGYYLDAYYTPLTKDEAACLVKAQQQIVIKPSLQSGGGLNVRLLQDLSCAASVMEQYKYDYVIQERIEQHEQMRLLNESSVNVVRITSFLFQGRVHLLSACVRIGAPGAFTDNYIDDCGGSMLTVGIDSTGRLKDKAYFANGSCADKCLNGYAFSGVRIPAYSEMREIAVRAHQQMPCFGLVGWDFVVEKDGLPTVMEYNISSPGITYYQYCNGPFFGDLTDAVLAEVSDQGRQ